MKKLNKTGPSDAELELKTRLVFVSEHKLREFVPVHHMQNKHTRSFQAVPKIFQFPLPAKVST